MSERPSDPASVIRELKDAVAKQRARLVPHTPEKYPRTQVSVNILDLEAALAALVVLQSRAAETEDALAQIKLLAAVNETKGWSNRMLAIWELANEHTRRRKLEEMSADAR
jgi:hypothetical protein